MNIVQRIGLWLLGGPPDPAHASQKDLNALHPELEFIRIISSGDGTERNQAGWDRAVRDYEGHVWVHKAIRLIRDSLAPLPLQIVDSEETPIATHPLIALFSQVNPQQSGADLWGQYFTDLMLAGESGIEIRPAQNGDPVEVWSRQPPQFAVFAEDTTDGRRYYKVAGYEITLPQKAGVDEVFKIQPEFFIHAKFYNPSNIWRGLAPIEAARMSINIDLQAQSWSERFFRHNARPDFAIVSPGMTKSEREAYQLEFSANFRGLKNAHRPIILEDGVTDIKTFSWSAPDTEWLEQRRMARDEIGGLFGVPDELMGFGKDTYENMANAREMFWTLTLIPLLGHRDRTLTEHFQAIGLLDASLSFKTDTSAVTELQEDFTEKLIQAQRLRRIGYNANEINERLGLGMPELPTDRLVAEESGRVGGLSFDDLAVGDVLASTTPVIRKDTEAPQMGSEQHLSILSKAHDRQDDASPETRDAIEAEFERQLQEALDIANDNDDFDADDLFDATVETALWIAALDSIVTAFFADVGQAELELLGGGVFDVTTPIIQQAINDILRETAEKVNDTTLRGLQAILEETALEGIDPIKAILDYFNGRKSISDVERIARTLLTGVDTRATIEGAVQSGLIVKQAWITQLDGVVRDAHNQAHGQLQSLGTPFVVGGESLRHPGDPRGSPANVVNCRCAVQIIKQEGE